jgi:hypothetical protein
MKVTEKLDQAELSISSWDSSEWAPHAVDIVAVRAKQKAGQSLRGIARGRGCQSCSAEESRGEELIGAVIRRVRGPSRDNRNGFSTVVLLFAVLDMA